MMVLPFDSRASCSIIGPFVRRLFLYSLAKSAHVILPAFHFLMSSLGVPNSLTQASTFCLEMPLGQRDMTRTRFPSEGSGGSYTDFVLIIGRFRSRKYLRSSRFPEIALIWRWSRRTEGLRAGLTRKKALSALAAVGIALWSMIPVYWVANLAFQERIQVYTIPPFYSRRRRPSRTSSTPLDCRSRFPWAV